MQVQHFFVEELLLVWVDVGTLLDHSQLTLISELPQP